MLRTKSYYINMQVLIYTNLRFTLLLFLNLYSKLKRELMFFCCVSVEKLYFLRLENAKKHC